MMKLTPKLKHDDLYVYKEPHKDPTFIKIVERKHLNIEGQQVYDRIIRHLIFEVDWVVAINLEHNYMDYFFVEYIMKPTKLELVLFGPKVGPTNAK